MWNVQSLLIRHCRQLDGQLGRKAIVPSIARNHMCRAEMVGNCLDGDALLCASAQTAEHYRQLHRRSGVCPHAPFW